MSAGFSRTLETASDAEGIAGLLLRASKEVRGHSDRRRLEMLAERYRDYAKALRETVSAVDEPEDAADQLVMGICCP